MRFFGLLTDKGEGEKYPAITQPVTVIPYPKKIQKLYESLDTALEFC